MNLPTESQVAGMIPSFPFQEMPSPGGGVESSGGGVSGGREKAPSVAGLDFEGLRAALESAAQALRSVQACVGEWERQMRDQRMGGIPVVEPVVAPRDVFPVGQLEAGVGAPRAVLTPVQQAQLDEALARAFSSEPLRPVTPVVSGGPGVPPAAVAAAPVMASLVPPMLERGVGDGVAGVRSEVLSPAFALVEPPPVAAPQPQPAPASLMAAAPPLPAPLSPFATPSVEAAGVPQPAAPVPAPAPVAVPPAAPLPVTGGLPLPFSPFQGLEPAPPAPAPEPAFQAPPPVKAPERDGTWPTSPFFGSAQAATAPFRMVEPPPLIASTVAEVPPTPPTPPAPPAVAGAVAAVAAPAAPVAAHTVAPQMFAPQPVAPQVLPAPVAPASVPAPPPPAAPAPAAAAPTSFPPIPDQGQVFNFAELLRANGQR